MPTKDKLNELHNKFREFKNPPVTLTIDEIFSNFPEGDFSWEEDDPGEANAYYCQDCHKYHKCYYNWKFERKDNKRKIERFEGDEDGNWNIDTGWEEGEDPTEILSIMANETNEYFKGWVEYDLWCADNEKDGFTGRRMSKEKAIKSAEENIKYLYMGVKNA